MKGLNAVKERISGALVLFGIVAAGLMAGCTPVSGQPTRAVALAAPAGRETATFAAGCFWSMEAIFKQLRGVDKVLPGYSGGTLRNPSYEQVETGSTGHAESVRIVFDPKVITYRQLLRVLLTTRNPTTPNQQGPDAGPQYRFIIFYNGSEQKREAQEVMALTSGAHIWGAPLSVELKPATAFYRAEDYHLDYYRLHPDESYCKYVIAPEIAEFRSKFRKELKQ